MRFAVHWNHSGSGIPACRNSTRDEEIFNLTADETKVTCKRCKREIAKFHKRQETAR